MAGRLLNTKKKKTSHLLYTRSHYKNYTLIRFIFSRAPIDKREVGAADCRPILETKEKGIRSVFVIQSMQEEGFLSWKEVTPGGACSYTNRGEGKKFF